MSKEKSIRLFGLIVFLLATLFFFEEFFLRVFLGTIANDIMKDFKLNAEQFSILCAAYYIPYAIMQIPVGILVDKFGVKPFLILATAICGLGVFQFCFTDTFYLGFLGRVLIGFGSSFAFVSLIVLAINWFPQKHIGFFSGLAQFLGAVGPLLAGAPLALLLIKVNGNWRLILSFIGGFSFVLCLLIAFILKDKPKGQPAAIIFIPTKEPLGKRIFSLLKNFQIWFLILTAGLGYVSIPLLGAYWGTSYLQSRGFSNITASSIISMIWLGYGVSCPIIGKMSDKIKRRKPFIVIGPLIGIITTLIILFIPIHQASLLYPLFLLTGVAGGCQSLTFPMINEKIQENLQGTAIGLNNTSIMAMGAIIPPFASSLMHTNQTLQNSNYIYTTADFLRGLSIMPILFLLAFLIAFFGIRETFCRSQEKVHHLD